MKRKIILFVSMIFIFILASCEGFGNVKIEIEGVRGTSDSVISLEDRTVKFSSSLDTFEIKDLLVPSDVVVSAYSDKAHANALGDILTLIDGNNIFYLLLSCGEESVDWTLYITKLSNSVKTIKSIEVIELDETYSLNEAFGTGVLGVTYTDGSKDEVEITADMVSGFDSSAYGNKSLSISYEGFNVSFDYKVVSNITSIEVSNDWTHDYLVGNNTLYPGGILSVRLENGVVEKVMITRNMVSQFSTSTPGDKELIITYKDKTTKFTYSVHSSYTSVEIVDLKTEYKYGDSLVGNVKFVLGDYVFTRPLVEYAEGFDSHIYGKQVISIPEFNLTANVEVINEDDVEVDLPVESNIEFKDIKPLMSILLAISDTSRFAGEEFDEAYNYWLEETYNEEEIDEILSVIRKCGITKNQVDQLVDLYNDKISSLIDPYLLNEDASVIEILRSITTEDITKLQEIISELLVIINPNQVLAFIEDVDNYVNIIENAKVIIDESTKVNYINYSDYIKILKAANLNEVASFMEALDDVRYSVEISTSGRLHIIEMAYEILEGITNIDAGDIHDLLNYVLDILEEKIDLDKAVLVSKIHKVGVILEELFIKSGIVKDLEVLFEEYLEEFFVDGMGYKEYLQHCSTIKLISNYSQDLIDIIKDLTVEELDSIIGFASAFEEESEKEIFVAFINLAKTLKPILEKINASDESKELLVNSTFSILSDKKLYSLISEALYWSSLNPDNITDEMVEEFSELISSITSSTESIYVRYAEYGDVVVPYQATNEVLLDILNKKYSIEYIDSNFDSVSILLTEKNVSGINTNNKGWNYVNVSVEGLTTKLYYYVYDANIKTQIIKVNDYALSDFLLYFNLNSSTPYEYVKNKHELEYFWGETNIDTLFRELYYEVSFENTGVVVIEYLDPDKIEFIVDSTTTGLKHGYIRYESEYGVIYSPFQYFVYDEANPQLLVEESNLEIYVEQHNSYYDKRIFLVDFGKENKEIFIEISFDETQELTSFKKVIDGIEFTVNVVTYEVLNKIKEITYVNIVACESDIEGTYKDRLEVQCVTMNDKYIYVNSYKDLIEFFSGCYENFDIIFEFDAIEDQIVPYQVIDGQTVLFKGDAHIKLVDEEEFYRYYYEIYLKESVFIVDSYDNICIDDILTNTEIRKFYNMGSGEWYYYDQLKESVDIYLELQNECDYYREYLIIVEDYKKTIPCSVRVVLDEFKNMLEDQQLYVKNVVLTDIPTTEEMTSIIYQNTVIYNYYVDGRKEEVIGEEAVEILKSWEPEINIHVYDEFVEVEIVFSNNDEIKESWFIFDVFIINEETIDIKCEYDDYMYICSISKEEIFQMFQKNVWHFELYDKETGKSLYLYSEDLNIENFEIITDLSGCVEKEEFEIQCSYYGFIFTFTAYYYK